MLRTQYGSVTHEVLTLSTLAVAIAQTLYNTIDFLIVYYFSPQLCYSVFIVSCTELLAPFSRFWRLFDSTLRNLAKRSACFSFKSAYFHLSFGLDLFIGTVETTTIQLALVKYSYSCYVILGAHLLEMSFFYNINVCLVFSRTYTLNGIQMLAMYQKYIF